MTISGKPLKNRLAGVSKNVLTLFECSKHKVSTTDICLDDIVAIKSFGPKFDFDDDDHDHDCGCARR